MTSYLQIRNSPYLIAFMLAAMMVWSFSAITRSMDGALQQTHVELRAPIADLGTAIQDSAISLKHRLKPQTPPALPSQPPPIAHPRPSAPPLLSAPEALTPVTVPEVTALTELIASASTTKTKARGASGKSQKTRVLHSSAAAADVLGPPTPPAGSRSGEGRGFKRGGR